MRERIGEVGGRLEAGRQPDGTFLIRATLPARPGRSSPGVVTAPARAVGLEPAVA
jgi:hypothetical protein